MMPARRSGGRGVTFFWSPEELRTGKMTSQHVPVGLLSPPQPPCSLPSSQLRARGPDTNKRGGGGVDGERMNKRQSMIYEHSLWLLFQLPCWGVNNADSSEGNVCTVPLSFRLSLSCTQAQREARTLLCLYLAPPLSFSPEIYLGWLLKRPSGCRLDTVEGPDCI